MSVPYAKVIINPLAGAKAGQRKWPRIKWQLEKAGLCFDYEFTQGTRHGMELTKTAVAQGYKLVVAVGGDGMVNEVVNGLIDPDGKSRADLGIISIGTANDFARSLGLPRKLDQSCHMLTSPKRAEVDVGAAEYVCQGEVKQRYFVNVAGAGFDAACVQAARTFPKFLDARLPYVGAFVKTIATYGRKDFLVSFNKAEAEEEEWHSLTVLVSNGRYTATLLFDPDADLGDGQFEVMSLGLSAMAQTLLKTYLRLPEGYRKVEYCRSNFVQMQSRQCLAVQADGELLGELPARFWVLPKALRVVA